MTGLFDQIKLLFEQQLYTNVVTLVRFNIVMSNQSVGLQGAKISCLSSLGYFYSVLGFIIKEK